MKPCIYVGVDAGIHTGFSIGVVPNKTQQEILLGENESVKVFISGCLNQVTADTNQEMILFTADKVETLGRQIKELHKETKLPVKIVIEGVSNFKGKKSVATDSGATIKLAYQVGALLIALEYILVGIEREFVVVEPIIWKGTLSKDVCAKRIKKAFPQALKVRNNHSIDAIGLMLFAMGVKF